MIHRDGRDYAKRRRFDDVRRVEPTSEADLQQQRIRFRSGKSEQRGACGDLEQRDRLIPVDGFAFAEHVHESAFFDKLAGKTDAFVELRQMGRDICVHPLSIGLQPRPSHCQRGSLAVRAGEVNDRRKLPFGMPEIREQPSRTPQGQIDAFREKRLERFENVS